MNVIAGRASSIGMCAAVLALVGCGGGGSGGTTVQPIRSTQPIVVDIGPAGFIDLPFTSITICAPGNGNSCQTIDHVQVDTSSNGLRILASALDPALRSLPAQTDDAGNPIVECMQFVDGVSWGPVKRADPRIAGESADSIPIRIMGDPAYSSIPAGCSSTGPPENTVADFGASGIIGPGLFLQDCGTPCASSTTYGLYYGCPTASTCRPTTVPVAKQVQNPGALFDNVAAPNQDPTSFDWGLPFFYGRRVYTAYEGRSSPAGPGALRRLLMCRSSLARDSPQAA